MKSRCSSHMADELYMYLTHLRELNKLIDALGENESTDAIRDTMDGLWRSLSDVEVRTMQSLSEVKQERDDIFDRRPTWDEYFMTEACVTLMRSPDPKTKHGAVIVNERKRPGGQGYNGFPSGGRDGIYPTTRPEKYSFVIHAEMNAILNCTFPPVGCTLYVTGLPCSNCMKAIVQAGITKVVYGNIGSNMVPEEESVKTKYLATNHEVFLVEYGEKRSPREWLQLVCKYLEEKGW